MKKEERMGITSAKWTSTDLLLTVGDDGYLRFWDVKLGRPEIHNIKAHLGPVSSVVLSYDEQLIITGGDDRIVNLYSAEDCNLALEQARMDEIHHIVR
jgi:WD40 repeat protein